MAIAKATARADRTLIVQASLTIHTYHRQNILIVQTHDVGDKAGVDLKKLFWSKFTHTFLQARPFYKLKQYL